MAVAATMPPSPKRPSTKPITWHNVTAMVSAHTPRRLYKQNYKLARLLLGSTAVYTNDLALMELTLDMATPLFRLCVFPPPSGTGWDFWGNG